MKIWVTRRSAFQIQCGGLSRLDVWFRKPYYSYRVFEHEIDLCLSTFQEAGCKIEGWGVHEGPEQKSVSFGGVFGYGDGDQGELADYVWQKLCEHFCDEPFQDWHTVEKEGRALKRDFILEIDLDVKFK